MAFGNVPGLQVYVVQQAQRSVPHAVDVASGFNIAAFNVGIAGGAWAGRLVTHFGLQFTPWAGALAVVGALGLTGLARRLDRDNAGKPQCTACEAAVGKAIADSGVQRDKVFVTTKIWTEHLGRDKLKASLKDSLRKLDMDYVDRALVHWPSPGNAVPVSETMQALLEKRKKRD